MTERSHERIIGQLEADNSNTKEIIKGIAMALESHSKETQVQFDGMEQKLGNILEKLSEARGGWKVLIGIGSAVGAGVAFGLIKVFPFISIIPK